MMYGKNKGAPQILHWIPQDSVGVEVGVWKGDSSELFLKRASHLHLVDPWSVKAYMGENEFGSFDNYIKYYQRLTGATDAAGFQAYYDKTWAEVCDRFAARPVTIHRQTSRQFFAGFSGHVDWVYLDGSHLAREVYADLIDALRISDLVMGDDYGNKPGVTEAVDWVCNDYNFELQTHGQQFRLINAPV